MLSAKCRPPGEWGSLYSGLEISNGNVGRKSSVNDDIYGNGDDDGWKVMIQGRFEGNMQEGFKPSRKLRSSTSKCSTWGCPFSCILSHTIQYYPILSISILSQTVQPSYTILSAYGFRLSFHIGLGCMVATWKITHPIYFVGWIQANWISGTDTWPAEALTNQTHWRPPR